jgi:hypothetical protein
MRFVVWCVWRYETYGITNRTSVAGHSSKEIADSLQTDWRLLFGVCRKAPKRSLVPTAPVPHPMPSSSWY